MTLLRGEVVAEDGRIVGAKGGGQFLERDLSPYARPTGG
jgi:dihydropyrimidinase